MLKRISDGFNGWWYAKSHEDRKRFTKWTVLGFGFLGFVVGGYWLENRQAEADEVDASKSTTEEVVLIDSPETLLEQDIITAANLAVEKQTETVMSDFKTQVSKLSPNLSESEPEIELSPQSRTTLNVDRRFPVPPGASNAPSDYAYNGGTEITQDVTVQEPVSWTSVGGLQSGGASANDYQLSKVVQEQTEQNAERKVTLPVGFMKARLLVGINARSGEFGMSNPQQLVFLVQAPAQLPNKMKMDLAGCFAVTNAFGDLSSGRIEAPPVSLTCLSHKGKFIAEATGLKGFVQDQDGKRGLDARVVSRARHLLASTLFARTIEAFGTLGVAETMVTSNSALGSVSTVDNDKMAQGMLAQGVQGAAGDLSTYLMDLAKQTHPVMEHGAGKDVLFWLAETTELVIKEMKQ